MNDTFRIKRPPTALGLEKAEQLAGRPKREPAELEAGADEYQTGRVKRDERGNAVWEWKDEDVLQEQLTGAGVTLSVADTQTLKTLLGGKQPRQVGYNPYQKSQPVPSDENKPKKKDLRALSDWIALKKARGEDTKG